MNTKHKKLKEDFRFYIFNVNQMINYHKIFLETNELIYANLFVYHTRVVSTLTKKFLKEYPDNYNGTN